jgi:hypothetical protein
MVLDYSQRRQVNINRPRKKSSVFYVFFGLGIVLAIYSLGILTGWFLYKASNKSPAAADPSVAETAPKQKTAAHTPPPTGAKSSTTAPGAKATEPPLTFYYTLPKGGNTSLGSGINTLLGDKARTDKAVSPSPENAVQTNRDRQQMLKPAKKELNEKPALHRPNENASDGQQAKPVSATALKPAEAKKPDSSRVRYTVQVASYQNRKEAEELKSALDRKGLLANVVESRVPGKGTYYRVRLGTNLDLETANKIASKAGKGAMVTPE